MKIGSYRPRGTEDHEWRSAGCVGWKKGMGNEKSHMRLKRKEKDKDGQCKKEKLGYEELKRDGNERKIKNE